MDLPIQIYNGKKYCLYPGEKYFSRGTKRLHVEIWKDHNGAIPKGYCLHHKDWDTTNNDIRNLMIMKSSEHQSIHIKTRHQENKEWLKIFMSKGVEASKDWHKSQDGRNWHSKHSIEIYKNRIPIVKVCLNCGHEFDDISRSCKTKFCSNKCKSTHRRLMGLDNEDRICKICGNIFTVNKYSKTISCSKSCAYKGRSK